MSGQPRYAALASSHELYCAGHLVQAAIALHRAGQAAALLDVARRLADHLVDTFLGADGGLDGHPIVETALVELDRATGRRPYLDLASQFIEQRGDGGCCWPPARAVRGPDGAGAVQRGSRARSRPAGHGSSTSTRCSAGPITSRRTTRAGAGSGSPAPAGLDAAEVLTLPTATF